MSINGRYPPWCRICRLTFQFPGGVEKEASGWIAGKNWVVGAAHCAYDDAGHKAIGVRVEAGLDGTSLVAERKSDTLIIPRPYIDDQDPSWDIVVIATRPFPRVRIGWLPYGNLARESIAVDGCDATIGGYDPKIDRYRITTQPHVVVRTQQHRLCYSASTHEGMSGSPVWIEHRSYFWVIGIHTHNAQQPTQAVFIDDERAEWIFKHR